MRVVGMDVHVRNSYLHVTDEHGTLLKRGRVANTLCELSAFLGPLERNDEGMPEPMQVVLESTTNSRAIHRMLHEYGRQAGIDLTAQVLHARKLRTIAESVSKCDPNDSAMLNEMKRSNFKLPVCFVPDDDVFALREHLRGRADLVRVRTMLKNRVHAALHRRGILHASNFDLFSKLGRAWLEELAATPTTLDEAGSAVIDGMLSVIDQLDETIDQSSASLRTLARSQRWCHEAALLQTMPAWA